MAGAGYRLFATGDVLTAAQVNTYLQQQTVMVFADSSARTTALSGVLAEGMVSYLQSDDTVYVYNGSAWVSIANSGDITSVVAGNGLSGGATSGAATLTIDTAVTVDKTTAQTLTNKTLTSPALTTPTISTLTTNGDLIYGTGSGALSRLGIGSTSQVLTVAGGVPSWATAGGGKVVQIVNATTATAVSIATTTLTDTGITATITPTSASNNILVMISAQSSLYRTDTEAVAGAQLLRGATQIVNYGSSGGTNWSVIRAGSGPVQNAVLSSVIYLDSPATTSATTYKLQARMELATNSGEIIFQRSSNSRSSIILMEVTP
jgi:hypothetical protein